MFSHISLENNIAPILNLIEHIEYENSCSENSFDNLSISLNFSSVSPHINLAISGFFIIGACPSPS